MKRGRKKGILSEIYHNFERRSYHAPHFLPRWYFNAISSIIQPSKLRPILHLHCRSYHAPPSRNVDRHLSSGSPQKRLRFISFVASCITQLIFNATSAMGSSITVEQVCWELGIDWYWPTKLTRGLMVQYLCAFMEGRLFSQTNHKDTNSPDIQQTLDNAAWITIKLY